MRLVNLDLVRPQPVTLFYRKFLNRTIVDGRLSSADAIYRMPLSPLFTLAFLGFCFCSIFESGHSDSIRHALVAFLASLVAAPGNSRADLMPTLV